VAQPVNCAPKTALQDRFKPGCVSARKDKERQPLRQAVLLLVAWMANDRKNVGPCPTSNNTMRCKTLSRAVALFIIRTSVNETAIIPVLSDQSAPIRRSADRDL